MFIEDPENPFEETINLENGDIKKFRYHYKDDVIGLKLEVPCMTIEIYDSEGNLISKVTEKNPHQIY